MQLYNRDYDTWCIKQVWCCVQFGYIPLSIFGSLFVMRSPYQLPFVTNSKWSTIASVKLLRRESETSIMQWIILRSGFYLLEPSLCVVNSDPCTGIDDAYCIIPCGLLYRPEL